MSAPAFGMRDAEQVAAELGGDVAFLRAEQGLYYARDAASPVLALLRGIHELEPQRARWIVRRTVWSTRPATATCAGAVRVAGKRMQPVVARRHGALDTGVFIDAGAAVPAPQRASPALEARLRACVDAAGGGLGRDELARLTVELARLSAQHRPDGERADRPIAALLASAAGDVLEWATNTGAHNPTCHAELNLVGLSLARGLLVPGTVVVTSLQPCKMCAAVLWDSAPDRRLLQVLFAEHDRGPAARQTILEPGTMARKRFAAVAESHLVMLRHVPIGGGITRA